MNINTGYNVSTPELAALFATMNEKNAILRKSLKKNGHTPRSPEYLDAMVAYRAYWSAVDAAKVA
jgi:hypothetical protein